MVWLFRSKHILNQVILYTHKGTLVSSHAEFGDSWLVEGSECTAVSVDTHPCDVAGYEVKKQAIEQCAIIQVSAY